MMPHMCYLLSPVRPGHPLRRAPPHPGSGASGKPVVHAIYMTSLRVRQGDGQSGRNVIETRDLAVSATLCDCDTSGPACAGPRPLGTGHGQKLPQRQGGPPSGHPRRPVVTACVGRCGAGPPRTSAHGGGCEARAAPRSTPPAATALSRRARGRSRDPHRGGRTRDPHTPWTGRRPAVTLTPHPDRTGQREGGGREDRGGVKSRGRPPAHALPSTSTPVVRLRLGPPAGPET